MNLIMDEIYEELIKGVRKPKHKIALFLCGAAGSGKTTTLNTFLDDAKLNTTFVMLNIDQIRPKIGTQEASVSIFHDLILNTIEDGYSFLYDGTCRDKSNILKRIDLVKSKGYKVVLGITYASLDKVLSRLKQRTNQPLEESLAKDIYNHLKKNVETYMKVSDIDELYLYNNENKTKLIFKKKAKKITCISPNEEFYFDVSKYC